MRVLFNAASTVKGGGAQRAAEFVRRLANDPRGHTWRLAMNPALRTAVETPQLPKFEIDEFDVRPSQSRWSRLRLLTMARDFQADCVYTLGGPAYTRFSCKHLMGVADGWVTHAGLRAYQTLRFPLEWAHMWALCVYKAYWFRQADAYVIQTSSAKMALHRRLLIPLDRIAVVPNTCAQHYAESKHFKSDALPVPPKILCFAAPYRNKRLELIPYVAKEMIIRRPDLRFQFIVTLPHDCDEIRRIQHTAEKLGVTQRIENRGPIPFLEGPRLYQECQVCFLPTVLETFSANYPEAMAMQVPMVTTNLGFARDVCGPAALYFEPNNVQDAAEKLVRVLQDARLHAQLVAAGREVLALLPTAEAQYHMQVDLIEALVEGRFAEVAAGQQQRLVAENPSFSRPSATE